MTFYNFHLLNKYDDMAFFFFLKKTYVKEMVPPGNQYLLKPDSKKLERRFIFLKRRSNFTKQRIVCRVTTVKKTLPSAALVQFVSAKSALQIAVVYRNSFVRFQSDFLQCAQIRRNNPCYIAFIFGLEGRTYPFVQCKYVIHLNPFSVRRIGYDKRFALRRFLFLYCIPEQFYILVQFGVFYILPCLSYGISGYVRTPYLIVEMKSHIMPSASAFTFFHRGAE